MQQEEKEAIIAEKMERMKKENQRRRERYAEVEADRQNADHFSSQAFCNQTNYPANSQPKYNNRNRRSDQFFGITKKSPHQRLPLADGPPPDPSFNFLSDPSRFEDIQSESSFGRHERGAGDSSYKKQDHNMSWYSRQDDRHKPHEGFRNDRGDFRGSDRGHRSRGPNHFRGRGQFHEGQQINSDSYGQSNNYRGRGSRSRGQQNHDNHGPYGNRYEKRNEHWKQERNHYDDERIRRSQTQDGRWRREWDADKIYHDNQRGHNHSPRGRQGHNYKGQDEHYNQPHPGYDFDKAINSELQSAASSNERMVSMEDASDNLLISIQNQAPVASGQRRGSHDRPFRGHNRSTDDYRRYGQKFDSPRGNNPFRSRGRRPRGNFRGNNERGHRNFGHFNAPPSDIKWDQPDIDTETQWSQSASAHDGTGNWDESKVDESNKETGGGLECSGDDVSQDRTNYDTKQKDNSSPKLEDCSETNTLDSRDEDWEDVPTSGNDSGELVANLSGSTDISNKEEVSEPCHEEIVPEDQSASHEAPDQMPASIKNTEEVVEATDVCQGVNLRSSPTSEEDLNSNIPKAEETHEDHQLSEDNHSSGPTDPDSFKSESSTALSNTVVEAPESENSVVQVLDESNTANNLAEKSGDNSQTAAAAPATADSAGETQAASEGLSQATPDTSAT